MANHHDHSYKLLFSHPEMVKDLLTGFVKEEWVNQIDYSTLEKVSGSYVTDELRDREGDVIWRVRWGESWLYVYLLLEFQSTVDKYMAVRIMSYLGQLIETIRGGLEQYRPELHYLLLDEGAIVNSPAWAGDTQNLVAGLFRLEHNRDERDMLDVLGLLVEWLKAPEQTSLRRAFVVWIRRVLLPDRMPGMELPEFNSLQDLHEVHDMLSERIKKWPEQWEERGLQKGIQKGRQQGMLEAKREVARNLIASTAMDDQAISELSTLPTEDVARLRAESQH